MATQVRQALPVVSAQVEMFSDVTICTHDRECRTVQVMNRWWLYDDGSYELSLHRVDDPMRGSNLSGGREDARDLLDRRTEEMWKLAASDTPVTR